MLGYVVSSFFLNVHRTTIPFSVILFPYIFHLTSARLVKRPGYPLPPSPSPTSARTVSSPLSTPPLKSLLLTNYHNSQRGGGGNVHKESTPPPTVHQGLADKLKHKFLGKKKDTTPK